MIIHVSLKKGLKPVTPENQNDKCQRWNVECTMLKPRSLFIEKMAQTFFPVRSDDKCDMLMARGDRMYLS
jgi:hypothetical protein